MLEMKIEETSDKRVTVSKILFSANIFSVEQFYSQSNINRCKKRKTA